MSIKECVLIDIPKIMDPRGNLSIIEEYTQVPFSIKRVFYLYDVPSGATRGGHALKATEQVIIALSGSFDVVLDDGVVRRSFFLNRPHYGLYIHPRVWRELENFSSNSIALTLASTLFSEEDYIRDYELFKKTNNKGELK